MDLTYVLSNGGLVITTGKDDWWISILYTRRGFFFAYSEQWIAAKKLYASVAVSPAPDWISGQWPLAPNVTPVTSVS